MWEILEVMLLIGMYMFFRQLHWFPLRRMSYKVKFS